MFQKASNGLKYDFISISKYSSENKDDSLIKIEKQLKIFTQKDLRTEITKLDDGRDVLITEYTSSYDSRQIQDEGSNSNQSSNYFTDYYLVDSGSIWQISLSSVVKDSTYLNNSLQVTKSFKLI